MVFKFFAVITFSLSRALEAWFDLVDYRVAKRAFRRAAKVKTKRRTRILATEAFEARVVRQTVVKSV